MKWKAPVLFLCLAAAVLVLLAYLPFGKEGAPVSFVPMEPVTIAVVTDPHFIAPTLTDNGDCFTRVITSADGKVNGPGYREYMLLRLDGENWESDEHVDNNLRIIRSGHFAGWNEWKGRFREGVDCEVSVWREDNRITLFTENLGIAITCVTTIHDETGDVYVALTGDQCAITNIHLENI